MKKVMFLVALVSMSLVFLTRVNAQDDEAIKAQIEKIALNLSQKLESGDFHHDYYADDAISLPSRQPMVEGMEALKANMDQMEASGVKFSKFTLKPVKVTVNGKMVTEIGTYNMVMIVPGIPDPMSDKGKYINIWEIQKKGDLKLKVEMWNSDVPLTGSE